MPKEVAQTPAKTAALNETELKSAIAIQKVFRGISGRKEAKKEREEQEKQGIKIVDSIKKKLTELYGSDNSDSELEGLALKITEGILKKEGATEVNFAKKITELLKKLEVKDSKTVEDFIRYHENLKISERFTLSPDNNKLPSYNNLKSMFGLSQQNVVPLLYVGPIVDSNSEDEKSLVSASDRDRDDEASEVSNSGEEFDDEASVNSGFYDENASQVSTTNLGDGFGGKGRVKNLRDGNRDADSAGVRDDESASQASISSNSNIGGSKTRKVGGFDGNGFDGNGFGRNGFGRNGGDGNGKGGGGNVPNSVGGVAGSGFDQEWKERWPKKKSWLDLDSNGYFSDDCGKTSITEICPDNENAQDFDLNKNGSFSAVFKGRKGLNSLSSQLATANNYYSESEYPIVSFAKVRDLEGDGATEDIYSVALKTKHGITQSFVDKSTFNDAQKTYEEEYQIGLMAFACREILANKIRAEIKHLEALGDNSSKELNDFLSNAIDGELNINNLKKFFSDKDYAFHLLKDSNELSRILKNPIERSSEPEDWLQEKEKQNELVKGLAQSIKNSGAFFDVSNQQPIDVYQNRLNDNSNFQGYFSDLNQAKLAEEAARKFSTHSASRIIGNKAEERIKLNAAQVDLSKEEAEEIVEKFLEKKFGGKNEKLIPKITYTQNGNLWGEKTVTRDRTEIEKETWKNDFKKDYELLLKQQIPDVASTNSSSVHRPRNRNDIATVLFDGNPANNRMFLSLKGTDKYVMAEQCKSQTETTKDGKKIYIVKTFENGEPISKEFSESQIGKVIIPKNTIFTLSKETGEYEPQNAMDLLKPNLPNPYKAQDEFKTYKNFKLKAISSVDGKRNMATLFQGEVEAEFDLPRKISKGLDEEGKLKPITFNEESELNTKEYKMNFGSIAAGRQNPKIDILSKFTVSCNGSEFKPELSKDLFIELDGGEKTQRYLKNLKSGTPALELKDFKDAEINPAPPIAEKIQIKLTEELYNKINEDKGEASESFEELKKRVNNTAVVFQMDNSRFQHKTGEEVKEESPLGRYGKLNSGHSSGR